MKKDTRQAILDTARALFNTHGYNGVSLRDISEALGISKGNLTYHFSKKEEIMEALLESRPDTKPKAAPESIRALDAFFLDMQQAVQENAYYFLHHAQLSQLSPTIRQKQAARYSENTRLLRDSFALLHAKGQFRAEGYAGEYAAFIDSLHLASIHWESLSALRGAPEAERTYQAHAWGLLHNLLTEKGRAALDGVILLT